MSSHPVPPAKFRIHWIFYYSKLAQIALAGPGIHPPQNGLRGNFTRGPPWPTQHVWRLSQHEITSHLCFLWENCLYPHSSLMMPEWGFLQRKMARKTLIKRWFYQIRARALARNKQQPSLASRDNLAWAHSFLRPQIFLFHLHLWRN